MKRTLIFFRKVYVGLLALSMAALLAGCGVSKNTGGTATMDVAATENAVSRGSGAGGIQYAAQYEEAVETENDTKAEAEAPAEAGALEGAELQNRKLIKTVDMDVETRNFDELLDAIEEQVNVLGGYIENMDTYNGSTYSSHRSTRNASMTLRIPADRLDGFLSTVSGISNVVRRSDYVEDVTLAYVDLESHRDALRTEQTRLLELLEKAETVEDIITIESRLSEVRYELESMESQLRTYDNQVDYSTVYLYVNEVEIYTPVEEETVWERISSGFMESLDNVGEGIVDFSVWFVVHIPYLVVWAMVLAALIGIIVWLVKRSARPPKKLKKYPKAPEQPAADIVRQIVEEEQEKTKE